MNLRLTNLDWNALIRQTTNCVTGELPSRRPLHSMSLMMIKKIFNAGATLHEIDKLLNEGKETSYLSRDDRQRKCQNLQKNFCHYAF
jgi:hypothetical protein